MTISMPASPFFVSSRFGLETNTQRFESPLTKATQRMLLGGARWIGTFSLPHMPRAHAAEWIAFFDLLEGGVNSFYGFDPDCKAPRGNIVGSTPLVDGGSQTGSTLVTDGWAANTTVLKKGDNFAVNSELKRVTADALTNGSGQVTISFKPAFRSSPANNAPITVENATCTMILVDDMQAIWETNHRGIYLPKSFSAIEVFS
jgi:hypothetical protein